MLKEAQVDRQAFVDALLNHLNKFHVESARLLFHQGRETEGFATVVQGFAYIGKMRAAIGTPLPAAHPLDRPRRALPAGPQGDAVRKLRKDLIGVVLKGLQKLERLEHNPELMDVRGLSFYYASQALVEAGIETPADVGADDFNELLATSWHLANLDRKGPVIPAVLGEAMWVTGMMQISWAAAGLPHGDAATATWKKYIEARAAGGGASVCDLVKLLADITRGPSFGADPRYAARFDFENDLSATLEVAGLVPRIGEFEEATEAAKANGNRTLLAVSNWRRLLHEPASIAVASLLLAGGCPPPKDSLRELDSVMRILSGKDTTRRRGRL